MPCQCSLHLPWGGSVPPLDLSPGPSQPQPTVERVLIKVTEDVTQRQRHSSSSASHPGGWRLVSQALSGVATDPHSCRSSQPLGAQPKGPRALQGQAGTVRGGAVLQGPWRKWATVDHARPGPGACAAGVQCVNGPSRLLRVRCSVSGGGSLCYGTMLGCFSHPVCRVQTLPYWPVARSGCF